MLLIQMEQLVERLVRLNSDLWQQTSQTNSEMERHIDDVVGLQMALKDRDELLARLKAVEERVGVGDDEHEVGFGSQLVM